MNRFKGLFLGLGLSLGAPLGWMLVAAATRSAEVAVYAYLTVSTALAFGISGYLTGLMCERQEALAQVDKLTGLDNRHGFFEKSEMIMALCRRKGQPVALLFCDVDGLKRVNDERGHKAGDRLLKGLSQVLRESVRSSDLAALLGGDEFVILLPGVEAAGGEILAKRIRERFESVVDGGREGGEVSVSIGVSAQLAPGLSLEKLIELADQKMYAEKMKKKAGAGRPG